MMFPKHVEEVRELLVEANDERYKILNLLTNAEAVEISPNQEERLYDSDLEKMWEALFRAEKGRSNVKDNGWVYSFLDDILSFKNMPPYLYISGEGRAELTSKILSLTDKLKKIYKQNGFNQKIVTNDGVFSAGFSAQEGTFIGTDTESGSKVSIARALDFFAERALEEMEYIDFEGNARSGVESRVFIRSLGQRNTLLYGKAYNYVIAVTVSAIYGGEFYSEKRVSGLLNRNRKKPRFFDADD